MRREHHLGTPIGIGRDVFQHPAARARNTFVRAARSAVRRTDGLVEKRAGSGEKYPKRTQPHFVPPFVRGPDGFQALF